MPNNLYGFAELILPLHVSGTFTYSIPESMQSSVYIGQRVVVSFGGKKLYTGIIASFHNEKPELYKTKDIIEILDPLPLVTQHQLNFWKWLSAYYMCPLGEVYRNAFPTALKLESQTFVKLAPHPPEDVPLNEKEYTLVRALEEASSKSIKELAEVLDIQSVLPIVYGLFQKGYISLDEKIIPKYTPKYEKYVRIDEGLLKNELALSQILDELEKAPKQKEALMQLISMQSGGKKVKKKELQQKISSKSSITTLIDKEIIKEYELQQSRIDAYEGDELEEIHLSEEQQKALEIIQQSFQNQKACLLEGVTSSGKTEVYFELIQQTIQHNQTVLYLLPEISITTQLLDRLRKKFGDVVGVYHSKFNANERAEVYQNCLQKKYQILIGARSALFLPFVDLGLIVIDEEHDASYKQTELKPYFQARDSALVLAKEHDAHVVLGSATPSLESLENVRLGKYGYTQLTQRFGGVHPPKIQLVDLKHEHTTGSLNGHISMPLQKEMENCLKQHKQVILFQNKRGYSRVLECNHCGYSPDCPNCDVKLNYHKFTSDLKCHYCGHKTAKPVQCPACHARDFSTKGLGTQQIEEEVKRVFPDARIFRMDTDTMRKKHAYEKLMEKMKQGEIDVLIGTQMVSKGLDFDNVALVGVLHADQLLYTTDFRSEERAYQLLTQVSGRAGRRKEMGKVLIQTYSPQHVLFQALILNNHTNLLTQLRAERKQFFYPPFSKLIQLTFKQKNQGLTEKMATLVAQQLRQSIPPEYVLGPTTPAVSRINNEYIFLLLLKIPASKSTTQAKQIITQILENTLEIQAFRKVKVLVNVDI